MIFLNDSGRKNVYERTEIFESYFICYLKNSGLENRYIKLGVIEKNSYEIWNIDMSLVINFPFALLA